MTDAVSSLAFAKSLSLGGEPSSPKTGALAPGAASAVAAKALKPTFKKEDLFNDFRIACEEGRIADARELMKKARRAGLSHEIVNQKDSGDINPLVFYITALASLEKKQALRNNFLRILALLVENGAPVDACGGYKQTGLHFACDQRAPDVVDLLLKLGADTEARDGTGNTPLILACHEQPESTKLLIKRGAKVNVCNDDGQSPLSIVCHAKHDEIIRLLLEQEGIDPNLGTYRENQIPFSPIHMLCRGNKVKLVHWLLKLGANVNSWVERNGTIYTPYSCAMELDKPSELVKLLLDNGAKGELMAKDHDYLTRIAIKPKREKLLQSKLNKQMMATKRVSHAFSMHNKENALVIYEGWRSPVLCKDTASVLNQHSSNKELILAFQKAAEKRSDFESAQTIQRGDLSIKETGWLGHDICLVFYKGYMAIVNRGRGSSGLSTAEFVKINPKLVTPEIIKKIDALRCEAAEEGIKFFYHILPGLLYSGGETFALDSLCIELSEKAALEQQTAGNCPKASVEGAHMAARALQETVGKQKKKLGPEVRKEHDRIILLQQLEYLDKYLALHAGEEPVDPDLQTDAYAKIRDQVEANPSILNDYPHVKKVLYDPEHRPFYQKAASCAGSLASRLGAATCRVFARPFAAVSKMALPPAIFV